MPRVLVPICFALASAFCCSDCCCCCSLLGPGPAPSPFCEACTTGSMQPCTSCVTQPLHTTVTLAALFDTLAALSDDVTWHVQLQTYTITATQNLEMNGGTAQAGVDLRPVCCVARHVRNLVVLLHCLCIQQLRFRSRQQYGKTHTCSSRLKVSSCSWVCC